ncbi:MAG TPA: HD domain-containing protein [Acidothermaceae bacterium]
MTTPSLLLPPLPDSPAAHAALDLIRANESTAIADHSVRSFLFAVLLAEHRDVTDFDPSLLFFSCVLHDIGLSELGNRTQRFEVDGADVAADFLAEQGLSADDRSTVWEAIALHTSAGIAERRGPVTELTRRGVGLDFGRDNECVSDQQAAAIHAAYPRLGMERSLVDEIVAQAEERPQKAPRYSIAAELLRERSTVGTTVLEQGATLSRWGT